ncbi:hypothetical protein SO802_027915 [Lithocarpus litseifolius]|uniref:F-box domain-containing protein n=1 Tax=Lithocarpus litseifolius TaxID=425828 RepID=A0AAW2BNR2_9ROSI
MRERVPDDIVEDILCRLPVKSLIRFRCVTKSCNSIITGTTFINKHFKLNLNQCESVISTNTRSGYLLYATKDKNSSSSSKQLCTVVCNNDCTLTQVSRFEMPSFFDECNIVDFCNGLFCLASYEKELCHIIYLWNPSIRMFKKLLATPFTDKGTTSVMGLAYNSQNYDFKILRIVTVLDGQEAEAEIYSLSTDSWRKVVISMESLKGYEPNFGTIGEIYPPCIFLNGALHAVAATDDYCFILSFNVNDESFREIMLPPNSLDGVRGYFGDFLLFKGSLAVFVLSNDHRGILCHIWFMKEYGVAESWTKKCRVQTDWLCNGDFFGCTNNGELLIKNATGLVSIDPESQNQNILAIEDANWVAFSANSMESLVLLDGDRESEREGEEEEKNSNVCSMDDLDGALGSGGGLGSSSSGLGSSGDGHSRVTL